MSTSAEPPSDDTTLLAVDGVRSGYGHHVALWDVSIEVRAGQSVAVIGANGAGKSTLLRTISGVLHPEKGTVSFKGRDITGKSPHEVARLGISHVPEGRGIFPDLTVSENLALGVTGGGRGALRDLVERAAAVFPRIGDLQKQLGGSLSGGEQQMVAIARGLMSNPSILMLDEPTLGLAPVVVDQTIESLCKIRQLGTALIVVEQNVEAALELADWGYVLMNGQCRMSEAAGALIGDAAVVGAYVGFAANEAT
jgi:branched-chain amino acid transport system ATP-binding protein